MENNNDISKDINNNRSLGKLHIITLIISITSIILSSFTLGYTISNKQDKHVNEKERRYSYVEENPFYNNNARPFFESKGPSSENKGKQFSNRQFGNFPSYRKDNNNEKNDSSENK